MNFIIELPHHNITLINFNGVFLKKYSPAILELLTTYNLLDKKITNKDVKKIFYHSLIHGICEDLLEKYNGKPVFMFNATKLPDTPLNWYFTEKELLDFLQKFFNKLEKMLPIRVCQTTVNFECLNTNAADGKSAIVINKCIQHCVDINTSVYTLQKIKTFAKQYNLTFISNDYLNRLKTKQIMI